MVQYRKEKKKILLDNPLNRWLVWLDVGSPPELIEEVLKMDSAIYEANERMVYVTGDEEARRFYEMRQMALSDYNSEIDYAREEGMEKGKAEAARNLKALGISTEIIVKSTGLAPEEIAKL